MNIFDVKNGSTNRKIFRAYFNSDLDKVALAGVLAVVSALESKIFLHSNSPLHAQLLDELSGAGLIGSWNYLGYLAGSLSILFPFLHSN